MIEKADGNYDDALKSLDVTLGMYPRDRVVLNQIARILFLKRKYAEALKYLDRVCAVDPEDVQMHYTRMLCYRGMGDAAGAAARAGALPALQSGGVLAVDHRQAAPAQPGG